MPRARQCSTSVEHGDITIKGANEMLLVPNSIVEQVKNANQTTETVALLIYLTCTASDINVSLGNYKDALANAQKAREWAEPSR